MASSQRVTVVVPAYNAADSIVETLQTVSAQTFTDLEILVVDDGSKDNTAEVVEAYARQEPRLRLIRQANGGVAAARNTGIRHASSAYIAPIDADDLWHSTRIEKHYEALEANTACAFVYSPSRILNPVGRMIDSHPFFNFSGRVFYRQLFYNMVGNGSAMMFRSRAALAVGGYDQTLRDLGLEGCEDWLLQMLMALDHEVAHVPQYLIGYRKVPGAMSSDTSRMWRSRIMATDMLRERAPAAAQDFLNAARLSFTIRLAFQSLRKTDPRRLFDAVRTSVESGLVIQLVGELGEALGRAKRAKARMLTNGAAFLQVNPTVLPPDSLSPYTRNLIERLREADEAPVLVDYPEFQQQPA